MDQQRSESGPASRAAALHRAGRYVEDAGGLSHGVSLHVHEDKRGALLGGKGAERCQKFTVQILAFSRRLGGFVRLKKLLEPLGVVDR